MYLNTTYKAFVAGTSAKVAAEISKEFVSKRDVSLLLEDEHTQHEIAVAAISVAEKLALKLEDWWRSKGDHSTVMFDPQDSLTSRIEGELSAITEKLQDIHDRLNGIEAGMEREYANDHDA